MRLTAERLREILSYDPDTGEFTWKKSRRGVKAGATAGCLNGSGYLLIRIDGKLYRAHRLAWFYMTGEWPLREIDHKEGESSNNRWFNLREASHRKNIENQRNAHKGNTSEVLGICLKKDHYRASPWIAKITIGGKQKNLGYFRTKEAAHEAYLRAKRELHEGCTI